MKCIRVNSMNNEIYIFFIFSLIIAMIMAFKPNGWEVMGMTLKPDTTTGNMNFYKATEGTGAYQKRSLATLNLLLLAKSISCLAFALSAVWEISYCYTITCNNSVSVMTRSVLSNYDNTTVLEYTWSVPISRVITLLRLLLSCSSGFIICVSHSSSFGDIFRICVVHFICLKNGLTNNTA